MNFYLPIIIIVLILNIITTKATSKYDGVSWNEKRKLWQVEVYINGKQQKFFFENEFDASKTLDNLGDKMRIPAQNHLICEIPNLQKNEKTSQYKGVFWHKQVGTWYVLICTKGKKQKYGGTFINELDAAKRVNQICEELGIRQQNPEISAIPNQKYQKKEGTSKYKGVYWNGECRKWYVTIRLKKQKAKYGGMFKDELDAAKQVNQLCKKFRIPPQNPQIDAIPNEKYKKKEKASKYKGVYWHTGCKKWKVQLRLKEGKSKFGGYFKNELDAGERVDQLYEEMGIRQQNSAMVDILTQQSSAKKTTSQYRGVSYHKKTGKWNVRVCLKGQKKQYGGLFKDELDAAKRVNQLCDELGIPLRNPEINAIPNQKYQKRKKTSQFKGVHWNREKNRWYAQVRKERKSKFGGYFKDEIDAGERVNQLCEEMGIPVQNRGLVKIPTEDCKPLLDYDAIRAELEDIIQILGAKNDPTATIIQINLFAAINYGEKTVITEINLRTENGESALSIAAQHGLFNIVKFLISKGANKEHFTNEHHTPLSLAVSQNHFKVVQVLLEEWISPNSHEDPYLYLLPIFNVKSREIAQLLVDNDAVTWGLYNNKNQSPLTVACQNGFLDVVQFFLDDGLDINHIDNDNKTPLFYAHTNGHHELVNLLISKGAKQ